MPAHQELTSETACHVRAIHKSVDPAALQCSAAALLRVDGMGCGGCATRVQNGLLSIPGVLAARVQLVEGVVRVNFDSARTPVQDILDAVATAGRGNGHHYRATLLEATW
jgi:copper chaperone CopZ